MPGLVRGVARTAAVVGTAGAVSHHQQKKWAAKDQQAAQAAGLPAAAVRPAAAAVRATAAAVRRPGPQPAVDPTVEKINQLAALHAQGILSDEEFAAAKAKALGI